MGTNHYGYQYLHPALILSPGCKAVTRLADESMCVVRLYESPSEVMYMASIIDFISGEENDLGYIDDIDALKVAFRINGLDISPNERIWIPIELWLLQSVAQEV